MLALIGCILAVLAGFGVTIGGSDLGWFALAFVAAHLAVGGYLALPSFRRAE
jgi:hypothetical protein